jgi:hypothetical protein
MGQLFPNLKCGINDQNIGEVNKDKKYCLQCRDFVGAETKLWSSLIMPSINLKTGYSKVDDIQNYSKTIEQAYNKYFLPDRCSDSIAFECLK